MCSFALYQDKFLKWTVICSADGELWERISAFPLLIVNNLSPREARNDLQWLTDHTSNLL